MKRFIIIAFTIISWFSSNIYSQAHVADTVGSTIVHIDSLIGFTNVAENWPWDVEWGPDNHLWFTVGDKVCRYDTATHTVHTVLNRPDTSSNTMSIAFHPNFIANPIVYVTVDTANYYYSYSGGPIVLYKYNYSASGDSLYNETSILGWEHTGEHCGARLNMGNDGYLYCTTSEYFFEADTVGNITGRVLRINLDGSVPGINIGGDYPISKGHRNPQGIVQVPNGNIFVSELGQAFDEINLIQEYENYGWPAYDGDFCMGFHDSCSSPTFSYISPIHMAVRPPSGITWYDSPAIPEFQGCLLQCILAGFGAQGGLVTHKLNAAMDNITSSTHYFIGEYLRWRDATVSPDGKVFAITNDRQIPVIRVIYNPEYHIGIEEEKNITFKIYPNPAENFITIDSEHLIDKWEIISIDGKEIINGENAFTLFQVDTSTLTPGVYFFKTKTGSKKFVKL